MLGKLLKYEFKSTGRVFFIVDALVLIFAIITGCIFRGNLNLENHSVAGILFMTIYILMIMVLAIVTVVMIIQHFYKSMLCGEGYLTNSLPVPTWMHLTAKTITAFVWEIIALAVSALSVILLTVIGIGQLAEIQPALHEFLQMLHVNGGTIVLYVFALIVQIVCMILCFYASMAIGGSVYKHKILASLLAFIVFMIIYSLVSTLTSIGSIVSFLTSSSMYYGADVGSTMGGMLGVGLIVDLIFAAAYFVLANYFLKKKLNLA